MAFGPRQAFQILSCENSALSHESVCNMEKKRSKAHLSIMSPELTSVLPFDSHLLQNGLPPLYLGFLSCFTANGLSLLLAATFKVIILKLSSKRGIPMLFCGSPSPTILTLNKSLTWISLHKVFHNLTTPCFSRMRTKLTVAFPRGV